MSTIPEGATTVSGEARDLIGAVADAAAKLGIEPKRVKHKLDLTHFRSDSGRPVARDTVKIVAWAAGEDEVIEEPAPAAPREPRESRDREPRGDREPRREREPRRDREPRRERSDRPPRREAAPADVDAALDSDANAGESDEPRRGEGLRGAEAGPTEASAFAETWFSALLKQMDVEGSVVGTGSSERVHLHVKADKAGRIIGKRGSTLGSIRHLLRLALEKQFGSLVIDVDVADDRPREAQEARPERSERRDDRGGRGRDRGPRGGGRDRGDRGGDRRDRDDRPRESDADREAREAKLKELARRAAEKAVSTGKTVTINLALNSYDRRIVHLAIADIDGVASRSEERDGSKFIQVVPG